MTPMTTLIVSRAALAGLAAIVSVATPAEDAAAASMAVKMACASDYYAYCSAHKPGSAGVKRCMRKNGSRLSSRCINALVAAGYTSKSVVQSRRAKRKMARRHP